MPRRPISLLLNWLSKPHRLSKLHLGAFKRSLIVSLYTALMGVAVTSGCVVDERRFDADLAASHGADASDSPSNAEACEEYCTLVTANCTADDQLANYASKEMCLNVCAGLPLSTSLMGNTVACRTRQASLADLTGEPASHCSAAGPGGTSPDGEEDSCGNNCESYCLLYNQFCDPDSIEFASLDVCEQRCKGLTEDTYFDWAYHHDVDTIQCRLVHLGAAASGAPETHCPHARLFPKQEEANCSPRSVAPDCAHYCNLMEATCTEENNAYDSRADCLATCQALPQGIYNDNMNTAGCRLYHAYASLADPDTHCKHAGPAGDGHCGTDNCGTYCILAETACSEEFSSAFTDNATCLTECRKLSGAAANTFTEPPKTGNNVRCRITELAHKLGGSGNCAGAFGAAPCAE